MAAHADEDARKREHLLIIGRSANWYTQYINQHESSSKSQNLIYYEIWLYHSIPKGLYILLQRCFICIYRNNLGVHQLMNAVLIWMKMAPIDS